MLSGSLVPDLVKHLGQRLEAPRRIAEHSWMANSLLKLEPVFSRCVDGNGMGLT